MQPRILVHLGASDVPEQFREASLEWVRKAVARGAEVANQGAKAEDIVAATVSVLEDSPVSDAGFGAVYNAEGGHQMDAGIMTGDLKNGAILSLHGIRNPIQVARKMYIIYSSRSFKQHSVIIGSSPTIWKCLYPSTSW